MKMVGRARNYSYIYGVRLPKWQEFKFKKIKVMKNDLNSIITDFAFHIGVVLLGVAFIILTTNLHKLCL